MGAVLAYCIPPHRLVRHQQDGAYAVIVREGLDRLRPFIWMNNGEALPAKRYGRLTCAREDGGGAPARSPRRAGSPQARHGRAPDGTDRPQGRGPALKIRKIQTSRSHSAFS